MSRIKTLIVGLFGFVMGACGQNGYKSVDVAGFEQIIENQPVQILDVRTAEEFAEGHLEKAVNIDVLASDFENNVLVSLKPEVPVAVYCRSGKRSAMACSILEKNGFKATNLEGGIIAWANAQKPIVKTDASTNEE